MDDRRHSYGCLSPSFQSENQNLSWKFSWLDTIRGNLKSFHGSVLNVGCRVNTDHRGYYWKELFIDEIRNNTSVIFQNFVLTCCTIEFVQLCSKSLSRLTFVGGPPVWHYFTCFYGTIVVPLFLQPPPDTLVRPTRTPRRPMIWQLSNLMFVCFIVTRKILGFNISVVISMSLVGEKS
jgi:hypothetical protein